jgi:antitoxin ChpS
MLDIAGAGAQSGSVFNADKQGLAMEIVLRKYGNSTVAVLPPAVLKDLGLATGQHMSLATTDQGQIVLARKPRYVLSGLIAQGDPKAPPPADLALWDAARPVGREVW